MTDYSELKRAAEAVVAMSYPWEHTVRDGRLGKTSTDYARLAHPSNVHALIAELESANARLHEVAVACATAEQARDQLKEENDNLRTCSSAVNAAVARENETLREKADCVDDCAHLIRKLVHCRRQLATDGTLAEKALDYLKRKGLQGSPLRKESAQ